MTHGEHSESGMRAEVGASAIITNPSTPNPQPPLPQRAHRVEHGLALVAGSGRRRAAVRELLAVAQRILALHDGVDLARALVDDGAPAVAQVALDGILVRIAIGAVDFNGVVGALEGHVAGVPL